VRLKGSAIKKTIISSMCWWHIWCFLGSSCLTRKKLLKRSLAAEGFGEVQDGQKSKDFSVLSGKAAE
jgi:hypothetical protein